MAEPSLLSTFLRKSVDPAFGRVIHYVAGLPITLDPMMVLLAPHRAESMRRTADLYAPRVAALAESVVARDPSAIARYDALIDEALQHMRSLRPEGSTVSALLSSVERRLYKNADEWLDDPDFPEDHRAEALSGLDRFNRALGTYEAFVSILMPLLLEAERRAPNKAPARIHDIASGHAGFAVHLKQTLGDRVLVEASDIKPEYLALGRARAESLGVRVDFYIEDALAMDGVRARGVDILLCTQALHHFPGGMVARIIGEASRSSRVGVCFIDGERSWLSLMRFIPVASLYTRSRTLVHDGIVSLRRMYYKEELGLLAALAPGVPSNTRVETGKSLPAHAYLRLTRETSSNGARE